MRGLNPSIVDEGTAGPVDRPSTLRSGERLRSARPFALSAAFRTRYFAGSGKRMSDLIDYAQGRLNSPAKDAFFSDNDVLVIKGGGNPGSATPGGLLSVSSWIRYRGASDHLKPHKLLKNDGT